MDVRNSFCRLSLSDIIVFSAYNRTFILIIRWEPSTARRNWMSPVSAKTKSWCVCFVFLLLD